MIEALRRLWSIVTGPYAFFASTDAREPIVLRALGAGAASAAVAYLIGGLGLARATDSDALGLTLIVLALGLGYTGLTWFLGGIVLSRPARLELRAWEVTGWAWLPAGIIAVSLLPALFFAPLPALVVGVILFPVWHIWMIVAAARAFAPDRVRLSSLLYVGAIFAFPALLSAFTLWVISAATAG